MGIGGNGVVPGRPRDSFGFGWARTDFSDNFVPFLRQRLDLGLKHEDAIEMYYNASVTAWLDVTLDLQIIDPGLKKTLDSSGTLQDVDTAVVSGSASMPASSAAITTPGRGNHEGGTDVVHQLPPYK